MQEQDLDCTRLQVAVTIITWLSPVLLTLGQTCLGLVWPYVNAAFVWRCNAFAFTVWILISCVLIMDKCTKGKAPLYIPSDLKMCSFNCHGMKSSMDYIVDLTKEHNVVFLCETWLFPKDIVNVSEYFKTLNRTIFMKSSIDPTGTIHGRSFGDIGFLCDTTGDLSFKVECCNDRLCMLSIFKDKVLLANIVGVYMPHNDNTRDSLENYLVMLDNLQSLMDNIEPEVPTIIMGDMNTTPCGNKLNNGWYRQFPYTKRSGLLFDFLQVNELCVANFSFRQNVNFTFNRNDYYSYIDHIFLPIYLMEKVSHCDILNNCANNVSDHFALSIELIISIPTKDTAINGQFSEA